VVGSIGADEKDSDKENLRAHNSIDGGGWERSYFYQFFK